MTYSLNGPRQPGRSDLSVRAGESFGAWLERVRRVAVIDPELADSERRRMAAQDQQRREAARQSAQRAAVALRWLLGSLTALVVTALLYFLTGLTGWIAAVCAIASVASGAAYVLAAQQWRSAIAMAAPAPDLRQAVLLTELDETCRELLEREQRAIAEVIAGYIGCDTYDRWTTWDGASGGRGVTSAIEVPATNLSYVVDPALRRRGHGTAMINAALATPELAHVALFGAGVEPANAASVLCLLKAGFAPLDSDPDWEGIVYYARRARHGDAEPAGR